MQKLKTKNGITLIALIITIIVMIVLAGVTVAAALNGGLFSKAKAASKQTQIEADRETLQSAIWAAYDEQKNEIDKAKLENNLSGWQVEGTQKYICTSPNGNEFIVNKNGEIESAESKYVKTIEGLAEGVELVPYEELTGDIKLAAEKGRISAVLKETIDGTETIAVVPTGFEVSTIDGENSISNGLVIKDGANEFVWIPVTDSASYTEDSFGPLTGDYTVSGTTIGKYDSYQTIQYLYGNTLGEITDEASFNSAFTYAEDKTNIEGSIRKYGGFYVGRYETTYDSTNAEGVPQGIGVKKDRNVLTARNILQAGKNTGEGKSGQAYYYRWYGLYKAQKDMYANSQAVFSTMITSEEWDAIMSFTGYGDAKRATDTYTTQPDKSGSAYKGTTDTYDISKNIYDLAGNVSDWTLRADYTRFRDPRGGDCYNSYSSASDINTDVPSNYATKRF